MISLNARLQRRSAGRLSGAASSLVLFLILFFPQPAKAQYPYLKVSPNRIVVGSPSTEVQVMGEGFSNDMVVRAVDNSPLAMSFVSANELRVIIPSTLFAAPGFVAFYIYTGNRNTGWYGVVTVYSPTPPTITSISPASVLRQSRRSFDIKGTGLFGSDLSIDSPGIQVDEIVPGQQRENGTDSAVSFAVSIGADATLGSHVVTLSKPSLGSSSATIQIVDGGLWQTLSIPNLPFYPSVTTLLDGRVLYAGGYSSPAFNQYQPVATTGIIDPTDLSWRDAAAMNIPRASHQAILLADGRVMVYGGWTGAPPVRTSSAEIFDHVTNVWTIAGSVRNSAALPILLPSGKVFLLPDEIYDPSTLTSTHVNGPGAFYAGALRDDGTLYVTGSIQSSSEDPKRQVMFAALYDPVSDSTRSVSPLSGSLADFNFTSPIVLPDGRVFIKLYEGRPGPAAHLIYDPMADRYTDVNIKTAGPFLVLPTGKVLVYGGLQSSFCFDPLLGPCHTGSAPEAWTFDPSTGAINPAVPPSFPQAPEAYILPQSGALLNDGHVLAAPPFSGVYSPESSTTYVTPIVNSIFVYDRRPSGDLTVRISGSNFLSNSVVTYGATRLRTLYVGANRLFAFVPAAALAADLNQPLTVTNAGPGGGSSRPLTIDYTVQSPPTISGMTSATGAQGATVSVVVNGANLSGVTAVTFSGSGITATIQPGGDATQIPVTLMIASDAAPGSRSVMATTSAGAAILNSAFTVQRANVPTSAPQPISEVEEGDIRSGYVIITPDANSSAPTAGGTYGMVSGGLVQSQAAVLPQLMTTDASIFVEVIPGIGRNLGVAIANSANSSNTFTLTLRDLNGVTAGTPAGIVLQPRQQLARFVNEIFSSDVIGAGFRGSLQIQGSAPFGVLGLRFSGIEFSAVPIAGTATVNGVASRTLTAGTTPNTPLAGVVGGSTSTILPQFAMGGGWATQIALVNTTSAALTGRVDVFDTSGNPMAVKVNGSTQSTFTYSISPHGTFVVAPRDVNGQSPF